jgi:DNA polymerase-1
MPDIINTVESINSIQTNYPELRQKSKGPTFALTYQGTAHALVNNIGLEWDEAVKIETSYHELYEVSDQWVEDKLEEASKKGYVSCAFGLKLRTPLLKQVLQKKSSTPYQAQAEGRTAGNALGQSWGLLNNRSGIEIQDRIHKSKYRLDIMPICQIHDSQYFMVRNKVGPVHWLNENLIETMQWQDHPDIQHPDVGLGGELAIYWPTWAHEITIPNNASKQEIYRICHQIQAELAHPS